MKSTDATLSIARVALLTTSVFLLSFLLLTSHVEAKLLAAAASPNSVVLQWTAPGDDGNQGQAAQYDIRYADFPIDDGNWNLAIQAAGIPAPQAAGGAESITIDNLSPGTTYYFAIKAADEVPNWSPISNVVSLTTSLESDPPASVINLATTGPTNNSLTVTWAAPGDDSLTGTANQYDLRYSTSPGVLNRLLLQASVQPRPTILRLKPQMKYRIGLVFQTSPAGRRLMNRQLQAM